MFFWVWTMKILRTAVLTLALLSVYVALAPVQANATACVNPPLPLWEPITCFNEVVVNEVYYEYRHVKCDIIGGPACPIMPIPVPACTFYLDGCP